MRNVFKWRIVTNKYLYLLDEDGTMPFIYNKITGERTYLEGDTGTTVVTGNTVDEGLIKEQASKIKNETVYCNKFNTMLDLAQLDDDAKQLVFQPCSKYFNLDSEECVEEAVTPKCEGYEPVFHVSAYTLDDSSDVEYTVFAERNEADKTLRYNLNLGIPRGEKGEPGNDGVGCQGAKGDNGLAAVIDSVTAYATSAETAYADVQMSRDAETNHYEMVFTFELPKGDPGIPGADGLDGNTGPGARIWPITASASSLQPGEDPMVIVSRGSRYEPNFNPLTNTYDTPLNIGFWIPQGNPGVPGDPGLPAIITDAVVDSVTTVGPDDPANVTASIESLGTGNTYILHFDFEIPQGKPGESGGTVITGGFDYHFNPVEFIPIDSNIPVGYFDTNYHFDTNEVDVSLIIKYPQNWGQGGGGECDIKHRYDEDVDSLSEGVQKNIDGDTYPLAVASGIRSHAEGIGTEYIAVNAKIEGDCSSKNVLTIPIYGLPPNFNGHIEGTKLYLNSADITICASHAPAIPPGISDVDFYDAIKNAEMTVYSAMIQPMTAETKHYIYDDVLVEYDISGTTYQSALGELINEDSTYFNTLKFLFNNENAIGVATHTEGGGCLAVGDYSHAEGFETWANGVSAHAEGAETHADSPYSHAEGFNSTANGFMSHAEGQYTVASGYGAHAEGYAVRGGTIYAGSYGAHVEGYASDGGALLSELIGCHVEGYVSNGGEISAGDDGSHAGGYSDSGEINANDSGSFAHGYVTDAGSNIKASGRGSFVHGFADNGGQIIASGNGSHAEGYVNGNITIEASGIGSHAEGCATFAQGDYSHAEGWETKARGFASHAEGYYTIVHINTEFCHAEGESTEASGQACHAEGLRTYASGTASHAEGEDTKSIGRASHAGGDGTIADQYAMTAIGKYNISGSTNDLFVIGNGTDSEHRSNALSVNSGGTITLNNSGGIKKQSGGNNMIVWNTTGGTTNLTNIVTNQFPYDIGFFSNPSEQIGYIIDITKAPHPIQVDMDGLSDLSILTIERLIQYTFAGLEQGSMTLSTNQLFKVKAYFLDDATDQDLPDPSSAYHATDLELGLCHIWTEKPSGSAGEYNVYIELYLGTMCYYTCVTDVDIVNNALYLNNAEYAADWDQFQIDYATLRTIDAALNSKMNNTPLTLVIDNEQGLRVVNTSTANAWLACPINKTQPVMVELWNNIQGTSKTSILGNAIATGENIATPNLKVYVANYFIGFEGDGSFTAAQLRNGTVLPENTGWDITLVDYTNLDLTIGT